jgi:alpha-L-fucosidase 2
MKQLIRPLLILLAVPHCLLGATDIWGTGEVPSISDTNDVPRTLHAIWDAYEKDYDEHNPLEAKIHKTWETDDGIVVNWAQVTVGTFRGKKAVICGYYAYPAGATNLPAIVAFTGGAQVAVESIAIEWARLGYACFHPNNNQNAAPQGNAAGMPNTDWGAIGYKGGWGPYGKLLPKTDSPTHSTIDNVLSPRNSFYFPRQISSRRVISFLCQQPQVNPGAIGVTGHSTGGALATQVSIDPRIAAAVPSMGGAGGLYLPHPHLVGNTRNQGNLRGDDLEILKGTIDGYAYYRKMHAPVLVVGSSNDFNAPDYNCIESLKLTHVDKRYSSAANLSHRTVPEVAMAGYQWFQTHLKGEFDFPETAPSELLLEQADGVPVFRVKAPPSKLKIKRVEMYYSNDDDVKQRVWTSVLPNCGDDGVWSSQAPVHDLGKPLFAFANLIYEIEPVQTSVPRYKDKSELCVTSEYAWAWPDELKAAGIKACTEPAPRFKPSDDRVIRLDAPAEKWENGAIPIGNGRLGGMVFGGVSEEHIQFNVDSLWTGDQNLKGDYESMGAYQNFGDLYVQLNGASEVTDYRRQLDIENAICSVSYQANGVHFRREAICSQPDQVLAVKFSADQKAAYSGRIRLVGAHEETTSALGKKLSFAGKFENGLEYEAQLNVVPEGGSMSVEGNELVFRDCDALTLTLAADTSYIMDYARGFMGGHPHKRVTDWLKRVSKKKFWELLRIHVKDYRSLYERVRIDLGTTDPALLNKPMDQRLEKTAVADPDLEELLFQYGRYLLIASSRPGTLPANLQGLWNNSNKPPWMSDYHSNINLQMNYWLAETANLSECHTPLFDLLMASREPFREATRKEFGEDIRGFTIRTSHNPYGGMGWKWNIPASAWYAQHFGEHYAFGGDKEFLKTVAYPYLEEVCAYWEDHLKELPGGRLVAPNGWSPEHGPREDGVSHDQQLLWDLFSLFINTSRILDEDAGHRAKITDMRDRLVGPKIGRWGQLQEWMEDRDDPRNHHRHVSHLFAVYPGYQISPVTTPDFAEAARVSLNARGDGGTGWARAWKTGLWARLGDGERACRILTDMIEKSFMANGFESVYDNKPLFQIDGNFGYTASMIEMLLQSHAGEIHLLPALPKAWAHGRIKGLRARGGFSVDVEWKEGQLVEARVEADRTGECTVRYGDRTETLKLQAGESITVFHAVER